MRDQFGGYYEYALYDEFTYHNGLMKRSTCSAFHGALNDYPCGGGDVLEAYVCHPPCYILLRRQ